MANDKSDVKAKKTFCNELLKRGYDTAEVVSSPADIRAMKNGVEWFFEIKMTRRDDVYFGAATETEWAQAFEDPEHYRFVVVQTDENETFHRFIEFTPEEFMRGCTIPPFKIYFNVDMALEQMKDKTNAEKATVLTKERFERLHEAYKSLKDISETPDVYREPRKFKGGYTKDASIPFVVRFSDGTMIAEKKAVKTFILSLQKFGLRKVQEIGIIIKGYNLVSDEERPREGANKWQDFVAGKYIYTKLSNEQKKSYLYQIAQKLNITIFIEEI